MAITVVNSAQENSLREYPKSRWFIMIVMMIAWIGQGAQLIQFAPVVGDVADEFGITVGQMSFYGMGLYTLVMGISALIFGFLIDRFGVMQFLVGAMAILTAMELLVPVTTQSLSGTIAMRLICGFATGPVLSACTPLGVRYFPEKNRAIYMGVVGSGFPLGMTLSLLIMGMRLGQTGGDWRLSMMTIAILPGIAFAMIIAMLFVIRKIKTEVPAPAFPGEGLTGKAAFKEVLRRPLFYFLIIGFTCAYWCKHAFADLSPGYIALDAPMGLGYGAEFSAFVSMLVTIGQITGSFSAGFIIDKVFKSKPRPWLLIAFALLAVSIMLTKLGVITSHIPVFTVVLFLIGFTMESLNPALAGTIMTKFPPNSSAKIFGLCFGLGLFAASGGIMIGSLLLHMTSSYQAPLLLISMVAVIGFIFALFFDKGKR